MKVDITVKPSLKEVRIKPKKRKLLTIDVASLPHGWHLAEWLDIVQKENVMVYDSKEGNPPQIEYFKYWSMKDISNSKVFR